MPNIFINAGEPDWFNPKILHRPQLSIDPRCTRVSRTGASGWRPTFGVRSYKATTTPRYFEVRVLSSGADPAATGIGLVPAGTEVATATPGISTTGIMAWGNSIVRDTISQQSGLTPAITAGVRVGVSLYRSGSGVWVQFYVNGELMGKAVAVPDLAYAVSTGTFYTGAEHVGCFDRDDMRHLPAGHQPWGAFMRLSDVGGYSPAPLKVAALAAAGVSVDFDGHTVAATVTSRCARFERTYGTQPGDLSPDTVRVFAVQIVAPNATLSGVGLINATASLNTFPGAAAGSAGIYWQGATSIVKRMDGGTTTAIAAAGSWVLGTLLYVFWQPSTGYVWFAKDGAIIGGGSPTALTGPALVLGFGREMYPLLQPGAAGSMRILTHRSEIPNLEQWPGVAAWDDNELLPEQHYKGRLASDTEIDQNLWFPTPWGGSRGGGTTLGAIQALNGDGFYDGIRDAEIRDTSLRIFETVAGQQYPVVNVLADAVRFNEASTMSLISRDRSVALDVHVQQPIFSLGTVVRVPPKASAAQSNAFDVSHTSLLRGMVVLDQGVAMSSAGPANDNVVKGFRRSAAVIGKQAASFHTMVPSVQVPITNGDFSTWTSDNPDNWSVTELNTTTNRITQNPAGQAQFVRGVGTAALNMWMTSQTIPIGRRRAYKIVISAWVSGNLLVYGNVPPHGTMYSQTIYPNGAGTYWAVLDATGAPGIGRPFLEASDGSNFTIDSIESWDIEDTGASGYISGLLQATDDPGVRALRYASGSGVGGKTPVGFWSDQQPTLRSILDGLLDGWLMSYHTDEIGRLRIEQLDAPEAFATSWTLLERDAVGSLSVEDDLAPALSDSGMMNYAFSAYSTGELAGTILAPPALQVPGLTATHQANKLNLSISVSVDDPYAMHSFYKHAVGAPPFKRYCPASLSSDGRSNQIGTATFDYELYTLHRCYMHKRAFFTRTYKGSRVRALRMQLGSYGSIDHSRHGAAQKRVKLIGRRRRLMSPVWQLKFWG